MRNLHFLIWTLLFFGAKGYAQNRDVIIWLDNSGSISNTEWNQMQNSVNELIVRLLACDNNRVAVVHYGLTGGGQANATIYIESDFTTNVSTALAYIRQGWLNDYAHNSLGLVDDALQLIPNPAITSPVTTLNRNPANELVVYMFTDAYRHSGSGLVDLNNAAFFSNAAFKNYTDFKIAHQARFVVTHVPPPGGNGVVAEAAAAAISSVGGAYTGVAEPYPADPEFGQSNRSLLVKTDFILSPEELTQITDNVCQECLATLVLDQTNNVTATSHQRRSVSIVATNTINNAGDPLATAIYNAGEFIEMNPGFEAVFDSQYVAQIVDCDQPFTYKNTRTQLSENGTLKNGSTPSNTAGKIDLYPNPSQDKITIAYQNQMKSVAVISFDGKTVLSRDLHDSIVEIDVSDLIQGIYLVVVQTHDNQILQTKFIKN